MMDWDFLSLVAPIEWIGDRLLLADVKPRHIGRVISFDCLPEGVAAGFSDPDRVVGTLEAVDGDEFCVSGQFYSYDNMSNIKIWRRAIKR